MRDDYEGTTIQSFQESLLRKHWIWSTIWMESVLFCNENVPQTGCFKPQRLISHNCKDQKSEVKEMTGLAPPVNLPSWLVDGHLLAASHVTVLFTSFFPNTLFLYKDSSYIKSYKRLLLYNTLFLYKDSSQIRPRSNDFIFSLINSVSKYKNILRQLELGLPFSRRPSEPKDQIQVSLIAGRFFTN